MCAPFLGQIVDDRIGNAQIGARGLVIGCRLRCFFRVLVLIELRKCVLEMESDKETPPEVKENIRTMMTFVTNLSDWLDEVTALPRSTLVALMKLGAKVSRAIPARKRRR